MSLKQAASVEFFWNKIKSLPQDELSLQQKDEVFKKTAVCAAGNSCNSYPEIFEFCFSQISPDKYPELLKRDFAQNRYYDSLSTLQDVLCFDQFQRLFYCLEPCNIPEDDYLVWLKYIGEKDCSEYCADAGMRLFMHMWMKEGFDNHRAFVIREEIMYKSTFFYRKLLIPLIHRNHMEAVWAVLDKANPDQIKEFLDSRQADHIHSVLKERGDQDSLNKFPSFGKSIVEELENSSGLSKVNLSRAREAKQPKIK